MVYQSLIEQHIEIFEEERYIQEATEILNEMRFSKEDLQDPKTLDKILKKKGKFKSTIEYLEVLLYSVIAGVSLIAGTKIGIATGSVGLGFAGAVGTLILTGRIPEALKAVPNKWYIKTSAKFEKQIRELVEKMRQKIDDDPKHKGEYSKVITNCEKVLAEIEKRRKEAEEAAKKRYMQKCVRLYNHILRWFEHPSSFGHTGSGEYDDIWNDFGSKFDFATFCGCCETLGIKEQSIYDTLEKNKEDLVDIIVFGQFTYKGKVKEITTKDNIEDWITLHHNDYKNAIAELGNRIYQIQADDSYGIYYTDTKKIIESDYNLPYRFITPYQFAKSAYNRKDVDYFMEALTEADKELGYYRLTDCPESVEKKPWPIK